MAISPLPCPTLLRLLLRYEPDTGRLFWRHRPMALCATERSWKMWNNRSAGAEAFTALRSSGYRSGTIYRRPYAAHRVAFAIFHGREPAACIDHINGVRTDNRIVNLREAEIWQNNMNVRPKRGREFMGVCQHTNGRWRAFCVDRNRRKCVIGYFDTAIEAAKARDAFAWREHGDRVWLNLGPP